ncbi:E3 ubiquitin-protein ligase ATL9-like [Panicum virgatum]|uniref:RING-type E3 ubiquitin transferase n=1 Tax=Panicum virgatum TaxID=38727 RepID=A0A8T0WSC3_PANVG|nr:E3 ubiquitin-protein ligase ATL9-like [Panicum virgatum]KAG2649868.1 hypothetical protein PVAP13_1NG266900 [Panicum virgatum]
MLSTTSLAAGGGGGDDDDVKCRAWYGVVVVCALLLLFSVLAATADVVNACAVSAFAVVFFGAIGWMVPAGATGARRGDDAVGAASALRWAGCACNHQLVGATAIAVPPAFTYECAAANGEGGGAVCAVCLEGVRRGETVRQLPSCRHLFHKECVDMWLHSHATCPLCRCDVPLPLTCAAKAVTAVAQTSSGDVLPPV